MIRATVPDLLRAIAAVSPSCFESGHGFHVPAKEGAIDTLFYGPPHWRSSTGYCRTKLQAVLQFAISKFPESIETAIEKTQTYSLSPQELHLHQKQTSLRVELLDFGLR